ncbi:AraC-like DNA-binding protein [Frondihabitans australicus]|uniref:AraC-like DNA-binding protein n=2 Tax=Frondihabitans australicus TaxID=386892 RepID=A0A495IGJ0_9MICO|nr:AraC-like DNA-binding protein [Frondihabitans australicus]
MFADHRIVSTVGVDESREALKSVYLPVEFPSAGATSTVGMHLNALSVGHVTAGFMSFQNAVRIRTAEPENYHVDIPTQSRTVMGAVHGPQVYGTDNTAAVFMPGRPVDLDCEEGFAQIALMIPSTTLQREMELLLDKEGLPPLVFQTELSLDTAGGQTLVQTMRLIDDASRRNSGLLTHPLSVRHLERVVLDLLLFAQPHNFSDALAAPAPNSGHRDAARAIDLVQNDPAHPWTISELAREAATSARSLHLAFRNGLDTTPMKYLQRIRLEKAREDLLTAPPDTLSVTGVANRWGFTHLGRFAAAYAKRFSELPSETIRHRPTTAPGVRHEASDSD